MWYMPKQPEPSVTKVALLDKAVDFVAEHGLSDVSLRQMAAAMGTSHRMLIYHFGSKDELLVAVVNEMERRQLEHMTALNVDLDVAPDELVRRMWRRLSNPQLWPHERLFFEVYGQALQGRAGTTQLLDGIVESWLGPATEIGQRQGLPKRAARAQARLGLAVMRGLLLDLLATGDRKGCNDAIGAVHRVDGSDEIDGRFGRLSVDVGRHLDRRVAARRRRECAGGEDSDAAGEADSGARVPVLAHPSHERSAHHRAAERGSCRCPSRGRGSGAPTTSACGRSTSTRRTRRARRQARVRRTRATRWVATPRSPSMHPARRR